MIVPVFASQQLTLGSVHRFQAYTYGPLKCDPDPCDVTP